MPIKTSQEIKTKARFLDKYQLDDSWYIRPSSTNLLGVIGGVDQVDGERVLVKLWRRIADDASELREIWAHEIRQLHRISGSAGALDLIVPMKESGEIRQGFYLVQSLGQREPLEAHLRSAHRGHWLTLIRRPQSRVLLWMNVQRVASALEILHGQGVLHRRLDAWSIFTDAQSEPDFQLGGFDWSMRVIDESIRKRRIRRPTTSREYISFLDDWHDLGVLVSRLLNIQLSTDKRTVAQDIAFLTPPERELVRRLLMASGLRHMDHATVVREIGAAVQAIEGLDLAKGTRMTAAFNLGPTSPVSRAIITASREVVIGIHDIDLQRDFIIADLGNHPLLVGLKPRQRSQGKRLVLQGTHLTYYLQPFSPSGNRPASWHIAFCGKATETPAHPLEMVDQKILPPGTIDTLTIREATSRYPEIQGSAKRWDQVLRGAADASTGDSTRSEAQHRGFVLLQMLETLLQEAKIWPAEIISSSTDGDVYVVPRRDAQRNQLAEALGLDPPAKQMRDLFEKDDAGLDSDWIFSLDGIGEDGQEAGTWRLIAVSLDKDQRPLYQFQSDEPVPMADEILIRPADFVGGERLLRRHAKALRALREHDELLGVFDEPRRYVRTTNDRLNENAGFLELDDDKRKALAEAWTTLPLYLVQGPPGVGKTRLVRELVVQYIEASAPSRLLLTAQSHHAVDHLMHEVVNSQSVASITPAPLIIRCRPRDGEFTSNAVDVTYRALQIVEAFSKSALVANLPDRLRKKFRRAAADIGTSASRDRSYGPSLKAVEALVLRSANLVFSTTNSVDLERIVEERGYFDLSVVEEAAKATGVELVAPFLLSHKRIAIGDHLQLPPFDVETLEGILANPEQLRRALTLGWPMIARGFRFASLEDVCDAILGLDNEGFHECGNLARRLLTLFGTLVDRELKLEMASGSRLARRLEIQHRMHPDIAGVVSNAFYGDRLDTHPDCQKRFRSEPPFDYISGSPLKRSPILFVDVPYVQTAIGDAVGEQPPPYHNPAEVGAIVEVLANLSAKSPISHKRPSLAVLSPYREQVRRIEQAIHDAESRLGHLVGFVGAESEKIHVGTVDSFQGSEADMVIISLVRNNHHHGARGLGFLKDARRMNVLLSRAKWQMVIVGSYDFLRSRLSTSTSDRKGASDFLRLMLNKIDGLASQMDGHGIPAASRIPVRILTGKLH